MKKIKAVVFDRDGTLIEHVPYVHDPALIRLLPGVKAGLHALHEAGLLLCLHTNQSGVGRGLFSLADVEACQAELFRQLALPPAAFARVCIAPEAPDQPSVYRKPSPAFARELLAAFALQPEELCYVGDRGSDLATAHAAGVRGVGIATGLDPLRDELAALGFAGIYPVVDNFAALVSLLLSSRDDA